MTARDGIITRIHRAIPTEEAHGEYIGLARFTPAVELACKRLAWRRNSLGFSRICAGVPWETRESSAASRSAYSLTASIMPALVGSAGTSARTMNGVVAPPAVRPAGLARWLESVAPTRARGAVTVAIVADARVRELNRRYRRKNMATDVLSFPADEPGELGDIVIALGVARRQAAGAGHSLATEFGCLPCTVCCTFLAMITSGMTAR